MFTLVLYKPYKVKWFKGEGGVKKAQNLVHVVCERPVPKSQ